MQARLFHRIRGFFPGGPLFEVASEKHHEAPNTLCSMSISIVPGIEVLSMSLWVYSSTYVRQNMQRVRLTAATRYI